MRAVSAQTTKAWKDSVKAGGTRPVVRATIEWGKMQDHAYNTDDMQGGDYGPRTRKGKFRSILFNNPGEIRELVNVRSISWGRSVDQDVAECTLTLLNSEIAPLDDASITLADDFDLPGLFTFSRGTQPAAQERWGHDVDRGWVRMLVPDRIVRTYEGYGSDDTKAPGEDPHLYPSGVWLIDEVDYNANGDIELRMRDLGRLLIDHIAFPPVISRDDYPLEWTKIANEQVDGREATGGSFKRPPGTVRSSNELYVGRGVVDKPKYVEAGGGVQGHYPNHAYTGGLRVVPDSDPPVYNSDPDKYWLSTGQANPRDMVWWEVQLDDPTALAALRISTRSGPYRLYISVADDQGWIGKKDIPYEPGLKGIDINARIPFVESVKSEKAFNHEIPLPRKYQGVTKVRITMTRLRRLTPALNYPWRAGLRDVELYVGTYSGLSFQDAKITKPVGNYRDFTDIIKWVGAWCGFYWPDRKAQIRYETDGTPYNYTYATEFGSTLPRGRCWGTFQSTGTAGQAPLTADQFVQQPLMDVIAHIREIVAFTFYIDEVGGIVWRYPNLFELGNYLNPHHLRPTRRAVRTTDVITIDENETLLSYSTKLSSRNVRERVFVGDSNGKHGAVVKGYSPHGGTNLMRVAGWTDMHFKNNRECLVAADQIVARQMFDYRRADVTIPGNPAIQIDDQIRIFERVTNETFYHYVLGVSSELDMEEGTWTYSLETHWLGENPEDAWVLDATALQGATQQALSVHGNPLGEA